MKKLSSIIFIVLAALFIVSCGPKEKVNTADAPQDIKDGFALSYQLSKELTELQLESGADMKLDEAEIEKIVEEFKYLAIVNNKNAADFASNKFFSALRKEYKDSFDALADTVIFLKDCEGYDALGQAILDASELVRDSTVLPVIEEVIPEVSDSIPAEPIEE